MTPGGAGQHGDRVALISGQSCAVPGRAAAGVKRADARGYEVMSKCCRMEVSSS